MINLSGSLGRLYAGYQVAIVVTNWRIIKGGPDSTLNDSRSSCSCVVHSFDQVHRYSPITKASFYIGGVWYEWCNSNVVVTIGNAKAGTQLSIALMGDPEIVPNVNT